MEAQITVNIAPSPLTTQRSHMYKNCGDVGGVPLRLEVMGKDLATKSE